MILKSLAAIPAVLLTLSAVPALALDISIGGSASSGASAGSGDSGLSVDLGATGSVSASAGGGSDAGGDVSGSASADASGSTSADLALDDPLLDVIELINGSVWTDSSFSGVAGIDATTYDVGAWINSDNSAAFQSTLEVFTHD